PALEDDEGGDDLPTLLIRGADYRAFCNVGMRQQCGFNFWPGNVVAGRNDHVVIARGEVEATILVAHEGVSSQIPAVAHVVRLTFVGEVAAPGWTTHRKAPDRVRRYFIEIGVDNLGFISGDRAARRAGHRVPDPVSNENVQQLGRADSVQDRLAGFAYPLLEHRRGQRFAGRDRE